MGEFEEILFRKLTGEITRTEELKFQEWMQKSTENELLFRRLTDAYKEGMPKTKVKGQKSTFARISRQLDFEEVVVHTPASTFNSLNWKYLLRVAAILVVLVGVIGVFDFIRRDVETDPVTDTVEITAKRNPAGRKTRINLPDGSVCWLNSESEIKYISNFSDTSRIVYLEGEAYFEVSKDRHRPFRVHTSEMLVTALGTAFNVSSFPEDNFEHVGLLNGRISVQCRDTLFREILPGRGVEFDKVMSKSSHTEIDVSNISAWKDGILDFNAETFASIYPQLERWYGVAIHIRGDFPEQLVYTGRFKNELLINVLESMSYGYHFDFKIEGKHVEITFN
ncbi:MAG: FecR domain-containing protein [Cytophagales bacterium]|nr:FecR domain-containing protein [Cytophagales bacterium]